MDGQPDLVALLQAAEADANQYDTITLPAGDYSVDDFVIQNLSGVSGKTIFVRGAGEGSTIIDGGETNRVFEVVAGIHVVFQNLSIEHGIATDGGEVGGSDALGGGFLIDGGTVTLSNVAVSNNSAIGFAGAGGAKGSVGDSGWRWWRRRQRKRWRHLSRRGDPQHRRFEDRQQQGQGRNRGAGGDGSAARPRARMARTVPTAAMAPTRPIRGKMPATARTGSRAAMDSVAATVAMAVTAATGAMQAAAVSMSRVDSSF